ncbi:hypothetical protein Agub_g13599 [Astrephomene gubernaculifera]|uniref:Guanylate cyclase domain-containing protein n=1 Tax=Astrephomene gubernaculifera TaxID=47775 RepID=A0AAD3E063_9CHLO|nr:hypothetical protein Agub_g13599 [Astrephomene gubernaculifera]
MIASVTFVVALLSLLTPPAWSARTLVLNVGATVGRDELCASIYDDIVLGYQYVFNRLEDQPTILLNDVSGRQISLQLKLWLASHDCTDSGAASAMQSLINGKPPDPLNGVPGNPPVHVLLGGNGINAMQDAIQSNATSRLLLHCCTADDLVLKQSLPYVFSLLSPTSMSLPPVLRTMALNGIKRIAVAFPGELATHAQLCLGALQQLTQLGGVRPGFGSVVVLNYTAAEAEATGFWQAAGSRISEANADALIVCDEQQRASQLTAALDTLGHHLSAVWLSAGDHIHDLPTLLSSNAEYALTTVQWLPDLPYSDPFFGTAADYAASLNATGQEATQISAAASASVYVLLSALEQVISTCDLGLIPETNLSDSFMWDNGVLGCPDSNNVGAVVKTNGQAALRDTLNTLTLDTFFGRVGFDAHHVNVHHQPIVAQVVNGKLVAVLPSDIADVPLVMPIPRSGGHRKKTATFIVIVTLSCCLSLVVACLVVALLLRLPRRSSVAAGTDIDYEGIKVDIQPVLYKDGTSEPGEGVYRGSRVTLVVATELLQQLATAQDTAVEDRDARTRVPPIPPATNSPTTRATGLDVMARTTENVAPAGPLSAAMQQHHVLTMPETTAGSSASSVNPVLGFLSRRRKKEISAALWRAMRLQHPRICPILGIVWEWPGLLEGGGSAPVIVRQWYEFGSLNRLLENETVPLSLGTKAKIAQGVVETLMYLQAQEPPVMLGSIHASNIIVDKDFNPHLYLRVTDLDPECAPEVVQPPPARARSRRASLFMPQSSGPSQQGSRHPVQLLQQAKLQPSQSSLMDLSTQNTTATIGALPLQSSLIHTSSGNVAAVPLHAMIRRSSTADFSTKEASTSAFGATTFLEQHLLPKEQQSIITFGLLLCRIFAVAAFTGKEPGLKQQAKTDFLLTSDIDKLVTAAQGEVPTVLEEAVVELTHVCGALGELARSCITRAGQLTFSDILRTLEEQVFPALTATNRKSQQSSSQQALLSASEQSKLGKLLTALASVRLGRQQQYSMTGEEDFGKRKRPGSSGGRTAAAAKHPSPAPPVEARQLSVPRWSKLGRTNHVTRDDLLFDIFPPKVASALQAGEAVQPERYECVSIFFSDVVGYTDLCSQLQPNEVMELMHRLYSRFDDIIRELDLFKVETVGDAYLAVGNLRYPQPDTHARLITRFAFAAVAAANSLPIHPGRPELGCVHIRVGLHCGPVVGSVVGTLNRRYCLFGDAVNTAARMEHNSEADRVHCSAAFAALLQEQWPEGALVDSRGVRQIKGKGPMETFWVEERPPVSGCEVVAEGDADPEIVTAGEGCYTAATYRSGGVNTRFPESADALYDTFMV